MVIPITLRDSPLPVKLVISSAKHVVSESSPFDPFVIERPRFACFRTGIPTPTFPYPYEGQSALVLT